MADFRQHFIEQFDRQIATGIIEFGKKLSNTRADVFILMARKAACFTECLEELGLTKLEGHVTTDRVLDMNLDWLKGQNVVIIDDAIVSGTTIFETINLLLRAKVRSIQVNVICVNKDWYKEELLINETTGESYLQEPFMKLKNEECIKLCSDIVTALSIFPRPYSVDFPLYRNTRISEDIFDKVLINSNWDCDEITSALQKENSVISLTITPRENFLNRLNNILGFPLSETSLCKLRLYGYRVENTRSVYSRNQKKTVRSHNTTRNYFSLKIVPMVVLKPISVVDISNIFDSISHYFTQYSDVLQRNFTSAQSKLRLIQHLAAHYLGQEWVGQFSHLTKSKISLSQDDRALSFLYPPHLLSMVKFISSQTEPIFKKAGYSPVAINLTDELEFESKISELNLISINAKLTEPFINLYHLKELKSRQLVKEHGKKVFQNEEYKSILSRLKTGFPLTYLLHITEAWSQKIDTQKIVSLFLDKSVDAGIVVPITGEREGILFRAYRHGEDVIFGELEEKLCSLMLFNFSSSSQNNPIPHIWTEKLLVLLLKIGVHKRILREFIYDNPPKEVTRIVSVKNYLYGQVLKEQILEPNKSDLDPVYLNEDQKSQWLSNILLDKKYISKEGKRGYYKIEPVDTTDINANSKLEAENIGDIFGMLYNNKEKPRLVQKDLVLLTSCLNPNDIAASMAAEIFIFRNSWERFRSFVTREVRNDNKLFQIIRSIRHENKLWVAVNSGQDKFVDFKLKKGHDLINQIAEDLLPNKIVSRNWLQFWSANMEWEDSGISEDLKNLINRQAYWLFKSNVLLRTLDLLFRKLNRLSGQEEILLDIRNEQIERIKAQLSRANKSMRELEGPSDMNNEALNKLQEKAKIWQTDLKHLTDEIHDLKNGIEDITGEVDIKLEEINKYTISNSAPLFEFVGEVKTLLTEGDIDNFKKQKLINTNLLKLEECAIEAKLILDTVDLIVSPFGKVEYAIEYSHAFFVDFFHDTEFERKQFENLIFDELIKFEKETFRYKEMPNTAFASFYLLPFEKNGIQRGVWIIGKGAFAKARLIKLITNIFEDFKLAYKFKIFYFPDLPANSTISIQAKNNNNIKFGFFYDRALQIINSVSDEKMQIPELIAISTTAEMTSEIELDIVRDSEMYFEKKSIQDLKLDLVLEEQVSLLRFKPNRMDMNMDIGIITIVEPEKSAIDNILLNRKVEDGKKTIRKYTKGFLQGDGSHKHSVVMTQQLIQGNESVVSAYRDLVSEFNPKLMVLFGIAGSISEDNKLCDVCLVNQVIDYDKRKEGKGGKISERGTTYRVGAKLQVYLNEFFNTYGEFPRFQACEGSLEETFGVKHGPIGSGNAVVGNPASKIKVWLKDFNSKILAVETEAVGFSNAFYEEELNRTVSKIGALIIRGISDHADFDKDDKWRVMASKNAAFILKEFVKLLPKLDTLLAK